MLSYELVQHASLAQGDIAAGEEPKVIEKQHKVCSDVCGNVRGNVCGDVCGVVCDRTCVRCVTARVSVIEA